MRCSNTSVSLATKALGSEIEPKFFSWLSFNVESELIVTVKLSGFGNFELHDKNERPGRNPKTGEMIPVSARRVVTFRSGQKLRARVEVFAADEIAKRLRRVFSLGCSVS